MRRFLFLSILFFCITVNAQEFENNVDCLSFEGSNKDKICFEYEQSCRDERGYFIKCSKASIFKKVVKKCRSKETGKYIKCPKE